MVTCIYRAPDIDYAPKLKAILNIKPTPHLRISSVEIFQTSETISAALSSRGAESTSPSRRASTRDDPRGSSFPGWKLTYRVFYAVVVETR